MPTTQYTSAAQVGWGLVGTTTSGFAPPTEGGNVQWQFNPVTLATWNQVYANTLTITASSTSSVVLTGLTNLVGESFSFAHVVGIVVLPSGTAADIKFGPGASNPLTWFFDDATATVTVRKGGIFMWSDVNSATGQVVDSTHKQLDFTNLSGAVSASVQVVILGRTT